MDLSIDACSFGQTVDRIYSEYKIFKGNPFISTMVISVTDFYSVT